MRTGLAACVLASLLVAGRASTAEHGPAPAVMTAMLQLYGRYDPAHYCWFATARDGNAPETACMTVAQANDVAAPEGKRTYLLLAGSSGHGDTMLAFVEFGGTHGLRVVAHSPALLLASPPSGQPLVTLQRLGASQWGWVSEVKTSGDDDRDRDYVVWLPRAGQIEPTARFPQAREDHGSAECGAADARRDCYDITVSYRVDATPAQADYYPILLQAHGTKNRRPVSGQAVARFDLPRYRYDITPGLP